LANALFLAKEQSQGEEKVQQMGARCAPKTDAKK
jgi:hypothetical protein